MKITVRCTSGLRLDFEGDLAEFERFDGFLVELAELERGLEVLRVTDLRGERTVRVAQPPAEPGAEPERPARGPGRGHTSMVAERVAAALADLQAHPGPQRPAEIRERCGLPVSCWNEVGRDLRAIPGVVVRGARGRFQTYQLVAAVQDASEGGGAEPDATPDETRDSPSAGDTPRDPAPDATTPAAAGNGADTPAAPLRPVLEKAPGNGEAEARSPVPERTPAPPRAPVSPLEERILAVVAEFGPCSTRFVSDQVVKNGRETAQVMAEMARCRMLVGTGDGCYAVPGAEEAQAA